MPKIIFTSRYIKGGSHSGNLVNYMATRDGVELPQIINGTRPATENQKKLIAEILRTVPDTAEMFEYEDYTAAPTIENASAFISMTFEQNPVLWSSVRNYVEYIARRPGAEKSVRAGHGLWNAGDAPITLSRTADEVANHPGNLWTHVISLRREDAERMGYTNADTWRNLVLEQLPTIAEAMKIPPEHLRWYAAYHDKDINPHIHMIVYSENPKQGYLTEPGIEKMRSAFARNIYKDEFMHIYERKDIVRSQLNEFANDRLRELTASIDGGDPALTDMLMMLGAELNKSRGRKQYGYLKPAFKAQVDEIVKSLAADPRIDEMYRHWCELTADVKRIYTGKVDNPPPLEREKTFMTIKNMVVRQALEMQEQMMEPPDIAEPELESVTLPDTASEPDTLSDDAPAMDNAPGVYAGRTSGRRSDPFWTDSYKQARKYLFGQNAEKDFIRAHALFMKEAESGNPLALHDLGYMHQHGLGTDENMDEAQAWYGKAYRAFCIAEDDSPTPYLRYRIAKLHRDGLGTEQGYRQAAAWFTLAANDNHRFAQYSLGSLYRRGLGVAHDDAEALRLFTLSANQGNAYAAYELAGMHEKGIATAVDTESAQKYYRMSFAGFEHMAAKGTDDKLQYRLGKMLLNGKGTEVDLPRAAAYFQKAAENKNTYAQYALAKLILDGKIDGDRASAVVWMQNSAEGGNEQAQYALGKLYLSDEHKDMAQAVHWLNAAAEKNNQYAQYTLGSVYLKGEDMPKDVPAAMKWLTAAAEQGNQFAQYTLGSLYLKGEDVPRDIPAALRRLNASAEQGNQYAQYTLGKMYFKGDGVEQDRDKAAAFFTASAAQGNEYAGWFLEHLDGRSTGAGALLYHLARMIQSDYIKQQQNFENTVDRKLMAKIRRKKQELGQKME